MLLSPLFSLWSRVGLVTTSESGLIGRLLRTCLFSSTTSCNDLRRSTLHSSPRLRELLDGFMFYSARSSALHSLRCFWHWTLYITDRDTPGLALVCAIEAYLETFSRDETRIMHILKTYRPLRLATMENSPTCLLLCSLVLRWCCPCRCP
ncbi:hypothetical protein GY45DRAFT_834128 [Cubamyces sp. BRFM 1775]|nr:hypothetical protein GY45DRAFT_834128 [Cubamyces sp. BRFM 1775]